MKKSVLIFCMLLPSAALAGRIESKGAGGTSSSSGPVSLSTMTAGATNYIFNQPFEQSGSTASPTILNVYSTATVYGPHRIHGELFVSTASGGGSLRFDPNASGNTPVLILTQEGASSDAGVFAFETTGSRRFYIQGSAANWSIGASITGGAASDRIVMSNQANSYASIVFNPDSRGFTLTASSLTFDSGSDDPILGWSSDGIFRVINGTFTVSEMLRLWGDVCAGFANGGVLTTDTNGNVICEDDDTGGGGGSPFSLATATGTNGAFDSTFTTSTVRTIVVLSSDVFVGVAYGGTTAYYRLNPSSVTLQGNAVSIASHASRHQDGGADEISVTGLSGLLADRQRVAVSTGGTLVAVSSGINFVNGDNVTISGADGGNGFVNLTISASTGGVVGSTANVVVFASTVDFRLQNTVTITTITASYGVGNLTLPANYFQRGRSLEFYVVGLSSSASGATLRVRVQLGTTTVADSTVKSINDSIGDLSDQTIGISGVITGRTTGVIGTVRAQGRWIHDPQPSASAYRLELFPPTTADTTIDTTKSHVFNLSFEWGAASATNDLRLTNYVVRIDSPTTGGSGGGTPGGSNGQFQYNSDGSFGGTPSFNYYSSSNSVSISSYTEVVGGSTVSFKSGTQLSMQSAVLEIPNGTAPVVDAIGEFAYDTTDGVLVVHDGTTARVFADDVQNFSVVIATRSEGWAGDQIPIWQAPFDYAVTIETITACTFSVSASTLTFNIEERAFASLNSAGTDVLSVANSTANTTCVTYNSFANASIAAKAHLVVDLDESPETGTVQYLKIAVYYRRDRE